MAMFMKDIAGTLVAIVFILYSLIVLLSVDLNLDGTSSRLVGNQDKISEIKLRFAFKR